MFEEIAKKTKYMAYTTKFDRECQIDQIVDAETIKRLQTYFEFNGFENAEAVKNGLHGFDGFDVGEDLAVTFLVDISGSMKGRDSAEASAAVLAATTKLEEMGASVSVLAYTTTGMDRPTAEWNGDGIVQYPGRLSELLHIVVKDRFLPVANAVGNILAMATKGINHENVDGEAIIWAANRMMQQAQNRKILVLVTDGFEPHCAQSERFASDIQFMKKHLKAVVEEIESNYPIDFVQVVLADEYQLRNQDTYRAPKISRSKAGDIVEAISDAIRPALADVARRDEAPAPQM